MKARDKILKEAENIFADNHYEHATVKMICKKAEVNIASVNYHFRSKRELYLEVLANLNRRVKFKTEDIFKYKVENATQSEWEKFVEIIAISYLTHSEEPDIKKWHRIIFREVSTPSEVFEEIYKLYVYPIFNHVNDIIETFFPEMTESERVKWFVTLISQIGFTYSTRFLISKYCGESFYSKENLEDFAKHISSNFCTLLKIEK